MEFSQIFKATNGSLPSSNGTSIASIVSPRLVIRSAATLEIERTVNLGAAFASKVNCMKWSPAPQALKTPACGVMWKRRSGIDNSDEEGTGRHRVLLADDEVIRVFDSKDDKWTAVISQGFGGIKNVEFGRNEDEILVFSEFQLKLTVWNLLNSRHVEIPHPKFLNKGFGYRPFTLHFAILTRESTHDVVSIHENTTYRVATSFILPTMDAQGLKWSPCGRWLAVWDSAVAGYKVLVYTADGHLFRTHEKPCEGLGIKSVEWSPSSDFLTIGSYDGRLCFLSNYTFSPMISMNHTRTVQLPGVTVWSEFATNGQNRHYEQVPQPCTLPTVPFNSSDAHPKIGISTMEFNNPDGTLVATKNDSMPGTVWIWSLKLLRPYAVLVHLSPVKSISWHPTVSDLLMIQCTGESGGDQASGGVVNLWSSGWKQPRIIPIPLGKLSGSVTAKWVLTAAPPAHGTSSTGSTVPAFTGSGADRRSHSPEKEEHRPMFLFGDKEKYLVGYVEDEPIPDDVEDLDMLTEEVEELVDNQNSSWGQVEWSQSSSNPASLNKGKHAVRTKRISEADLIPQTPGDETFEFRLRSSTRA